MDRPHERIAGAAPSTSPTVRGNKPRGKGRGGRGQDEGSHHSCPVCVATAWVVGCKLRGDSDSGVVPLRDLGLSRQHCTASLRSAQPKSTHESVWGTWRCRVGSGVAWMFLRLNFLMLPAVRIQYCTEGETHRPGRAPFLCSKLQCIPQRRGDSPGGQLPQTFCLSVWCGFLAES